MVNLSIGCLIVEALKTKAHGIGSRVIPDSVTAEMHRKQAEPGSP